MTNKNRSLPYTSIIVGDTTADEVRATVADAPTISCFGIPQFGNRQLGIGVLACWDTLNGRAVDNGRYPPIERVREILDAAAEPYHHRSPWQGQNEGTVFDLKTRCLRLIHYSSREPNLLAQLDRLCEMAGPNLDGFQFNIDWPLKADLRFWMQDHPSMRVVLRINHQMFSNVGRNQQLLVNEVGKYLPGSITDIPGCITDIIFDTTYHPGQKFNLTEAKLILETLYGAFGDHVGIGLAGDFTRESVWDLKPFFEKWPNLSIASEANAPGEAAREYVNRSFGVMPLR